MNIEEHLRGEHTFWPWTKTVPPLKELRAAVELEKTRRPPRLRILRWLQNRVRVLENEELLKSNE